MKEGSPWRLGVQAGSSSPPVRFPLEKAKTGRQNYCRLPLFSVSMADITNRSQPPFPFSTLYSRRSPSTGQSWDLQRTWLAHWVLDWEGETGYEKDGPWSTNKRTGKSCRKGWANGWKGSRRGRGQGWLWIWILGGGENVFDIVSERKAGCGWRCGVQLFGWRPGGFRPCWAGGLWGISERKHSIHTWR